MGPLFVAVVFGLLVWQTAAWVRGQAVADLIDAGRRQLELYVTHLTYIPHPDRLTRQVF